MCFRGDSINWSKSDVCTHTLCRLLHKKFKFVFPKALSNGLGHHNIAPSTPKSHQSRFVQCISVTHYLNFLSPVQFHLLTAWRLFLPKRSFLFEEGADGFAQVQMWTTTPTSKTRQKSVSFSRQEKLGCRFLSESLVLDHFSAFLSLKSGSPWLNIHNQHRAIIE